MLNGGNAFVLRSQIPFQHVVFCKQVCCLQALLRGVHTTLIKHIQYSFKSCHFSWHVSVCALQKIETEVPHCSSLKCYYLAHVIFQT